MTKNALRIALLASLAFGHTITLGKPGRVYTTRRTVMAAEIHIWQPASGGDALADASWDTLAPAGQASEFGTFSGVPLNNDTVAINANGIVTPGSDKTYTFKTALTPAANEVLIGADSAECARNLVSAIMADGNTTRYGTGTVAHDAVTAVLSGSDVQLTSVHYGTDPNGIVLAESATNFVWDGGAVVLSGGVTTWTVSDAEIVLDGDNHSDLTSNLDWGVLLSPSISIGKVTKQSGNFSAIGAPGTPWVVESKASGLVNLLGSGAVYYEAYDTISTAPDMIVDGPELAVVTGELGSLHVLGSSRVECSAQMITTAGPGGSTVTISGARAVVLLLDQTLQSPTEIIVNAGFLQCDRDLDLYDSVKVGDGHCLLKGKLLTGCSVSIVGQGSLDIQPRTASGANLPGLFLMSGRTTFVNSKFNITPLKLVIGKNASVEFGPVAVAATLGVVDLRKRHP